MTKADRDFIEEKFKGVYLRLDSMRDEFKSNTENAVMKHQMTCPVATEIKEIKGEQQKYWLLKKYPTVFIIGGVVYGLFIIWLSLTQIGII